MSEGLITDEKYMRFKDADWFSNIPISVMVAGVGGTGSWSAMLLARAGFYPICFDADSYERVNMAGQLISKQQIGKPKVSAIAETIQNYCDMSIYTFNEKVDENTPVSDYIFSCFDNMKSRKILFKSWSKSEYENGLLIDLRLSAERLQIFCVTKENKDRYLKHLYTDEEIPDEVCTFKQTSHAAAMIASHAVGFFTNHIVNVKNQENIRQVPFFFEYFIPFNITKNEIIDE